MNENTVDPRLEELLLEIIAWLRFQNRATLVSLLHDALQEYRDWRIYDLTDGRHSQDEIAKIVGVSQPTVLRIWNKWKAVGIVTEGGEIKGRCKQLARLSDLGIEVPQSAPARMDKKADG